MPASRKFPVLSIDTQADFYYRLQHIKQLSLYEALTITLKSISTHELDTQLHALVGDGTLGKFTPLGLRGEVMFPVPTVLQANPYLLSYYRLLYGFSQKEFYAKGGFGIFKNMEEKGQLSPTAQAQLRPLCESMIASGKQLLEQLDDFSVEIVKELQLLTLGPQFRGSLNNKFGAAAAQKVFSIIKDLVHPYIIKLGPASIEIKNASGRMVKIAVASDPDIEIVEILNSGSRGLVSIEIKGGQDISNIHNRIGEAEKSHQKAKQRGYFEFITLINVDIDYTVLKAESPTTSHFFHLGHIGAPTSPEHALFRDILASILGIGHS
jgi:hypothetical protein